MNCPIYTYIPLCSWKKNCLTSLEVRQFFFNCTEVETTDSAWKPGQLSLSLVVSAFGQHANAANIASLCSSGVSHIDDEDLIIAVEKLTLFSLILMTLSLLNQSWNPQPTSEFFPHKKIDDHQFKLLLNATSLAEKAFPCQLLHLMHLLG